MHKKDLLWFGPVYSYSGYATHNRCMIFELHKLGWNIRLFPTETSPPPELIGKNLLLQLANNKSIDLENSICINLVPPPATPLYSKYSILFTTMESLTVHPGFLNRCTLFDEVWFPCKFNVKSFKKTHFPSKDIFYCPEGVYPEFWSPDNSLDKQWQSPYFTFFYNGDWSFRKGMDILLKAYSIAFHPAEPVRLLMLAHYQGNNADVSRQAINGEIHDICNRNNILSLPRIEFEFSHIPDPILPSIYNSSDVYVSPTRGEAWGLPIIQAMSCGLSPIIPAWGGHRDYTTNKNSFLCDIEKFDIMDDKVDLYVDFYKNQLFAFPDVKHFAKLMRYAFTHQDECKRRGKIARENVSKHFHWSNSAKIADKRLRWIYETKFR